MKAHLWLAVIAMNIASGIGYFTAGEDKASIKANNWGLTGPGMAGAWERLKAKPWSAHEWKNVHTTWIETAPAQQSPAKAGSVPFLFAAAAAVILFIF